MSNSYGEGGPAGTEKINTEIVTLSRHLSEEQVKHKEATGDFTYAMPILLPAPKLTRLSLTDFYATHCNSPSSRLHTISAEHH